MNHKNIEIHYRENIEELIAIYSRKFGKLNAEDCIQETYTQLLEKELSITEFENIFKRVIKKHFKQEKMKGMT